MEKTFTLKGTHLFSVFIFIVFVLGSHSTYGKSVILYTPYTKIAVPPGETIDYSIEVINNSSVIKNARISISGFPKEWTYSLKSGGWSFEEIAVLPGEKKTMTLQVEVPLKIENGTYKFGVVAAGLDYLPLSVTISEQGTFKSEFISEQPNMEGHADASFTFNTELKNQTAEEQQYSLRARAPRGWSVKFKPNYKQATSVTVSPNSTETISIEVDPPSMVEAKTYKIPVEAVTASTSADLILEVVITGSYELNLTTPTGLLSTKATAGDESQSAGEGDSEGEAAGSEAEAEAEVEAAGSDHDSQPGRYPLQPGPGGEGRGQGTGWRGGGGSGSHRLGGGVRRRRG